jgi:hypothetical protein
VTEQSTVSYIAGNGRLRATYTGNYEIPETVKSVTIVGVSERPGDGTVKVGGKSVDGWEWKEASLELVIRGLDVGMNGDWAVEW